MSLWSYVYLEQSIINSDYLYETTIHSFVVMCVRIVWPFQSVTFVNVGLKETQQHSYVCKRKANGNAMATTHHTLPHGGQRYLYMYLIANESQFGSLFCWMAFCRFCCCCCHRSMYWCSFEINKQQQQPQINWIATNMLIN